MNYIGIDIGMLKCAAYVMDESGNILYEAVFDNSIKDAKKFTDHVKQKYGSCIAVCESTGNMWIRVFATLEEEGIHTILANPYRVRPIANSSIKTDKIDARALATLLRLRAVPKCYVQDKKSRDEIALLQHRIAIVQDRTRIVNRIHNLLYRFELDKSDLKSKNVKGSKYLDWLSKQDLGSSTTILKQNISQIRKLDEDEQELNKLIEQAARDNKDAQLIMSIPGFRYFSSLLIADEIGDIRRFASPSKLVSWAGVCSRVYQSGNTIRYGKMKKDSNRKVNWVVLQCALVAVKHDARLATVYERACARHPKKVALTHVGNKIITIIWHMLTYRKPYVQLDPNMHKRSNPKNVRTEKEHTSDEDLLAVPI